MGKRSILTPKRLHFARCVASGMSQSDAYREAYNVKEDTKPETVWEEASKLMRIPEVSTRVDALIALKDKAIIRSASGLRSKVFEKLDYFMDHAEPSDSVKLKAVELTGKTLGLFKDVLETTDVTDKSAAELQQELLERVAELLGVSQEDVSKSMH